MKLLNVVLSFCVLFVVSGAVADEPYNPKTILVVAYEPFDGRKANGSETAAMYLKGKKFEVLPRDTGVVYTVKVLVLPVVWQEPERLATRYIRDHKPSLVLGMGECGTYTEMRFETRAVNLRSGQDENGECPITNYISKGGPYFKHTRLKFNKDLFDCKFTKSRFAGNYLCNNLFYVTLGATKAPVGFVHLPSQRDASDEDYLKLVQKNLILLLEDNLEAKLYTPKPRADQGDIAPPPPEEDDIPMIFFDIPE